MSSARVLRFTSFVCGAVLLTGCESGPRAPVAMAMAPGNTITGEGLPNPNPVVMANWGELPEGRGTRPEPRVTRSSNSARRVKCC